MIPKIDRVAWAFVLLLVIGLILILMWFSIGDAFGDEIFEKDGCIYIVGHPSKREIIENEKYLQDRADRRRKHFEKQDERKHELKLKRLELEIEQERRETNEAYLLGLIKEGIGTTSININTKGGRGGRSYVEGIYSSGGNAYSSSASKSNSISESNSGSNVGDITNTNRNTNNNK